MKLLHGDCLDILPTLESDSIDLIVIDPPYNINKASWDKWKHQENYIEWLGSVFLECQRVLKDNGSFYFFHNNFLTIVKLQAWIEKNTRFIFKQLITWDKIIDNIINGFIIQRLSIDMQRNYYGGFTEYILYYTFQDETGLSTVMLDKNNFPTLRAYYKDLQEWLGLNIKQINAKLGDRTAEHAFYWGTTQWGLSTSETYQKLIDLLHINEWQGFREYESLRQEYESLRYVFNVQNVKEDMRSNACVWQYPNACTKNHITAKPVKLIENIIKHSSNKGGVVLDCFMGSGTTGVACKNLGRDFIGIEKESEYVEIARERLQEKYGLFTNMPKEANNE